MSEEKTEQKTEQKTTELDKMTQAYTKTKNSVKKFGAKYRWTLFVICFIWMFITFILTCCVMGEAYGGGVFMNGFAFGIFWFALYWFIVCYCFYLGIKRKAVTEDVRNLVIIGTSVACFCLLVSYACLGAASHTGVSIANIVFGFFGMFAIFGATFPLLDLQKVLVK